MRLKLANVTFSSKLSILIIYVSCCVAYRYTVHGISEILVHTLFAASRNINEL